jgi:hypothetical protein
MVAEAKCKVAKRNMRRLGAWIGVSFFGILSFAFTVIVVIVVERLTGFNLFTLTILIVVPLGALTTGAAAASGYYFGSLVFQVRPTWLLLAQIVLAAAAAQLAIYYSEYATLVLDNGAKASAIVSFQEYLVYYLTTTHLRLGRAATIDTGEVGSFGYWLAAIQFVGFIIGGIGVYWLLVGEPTCQACGRYLRVLLSHGQYFNHQDEFAQYYDTVFRWPIDSSEFAEWIHWQPHRGKKEAGSIAVVSTLRGCPYCKRQRVTQQVKVMTAKEWKDIPTLARSVNVPEGVDLRVLFRQSPG